MWTHERSAVVWTNYEYSEEFARRKFQLVALVFLQRERVTGALHRRVVYIFLFLSLLKFRNKIAPALRRPSRIDNRSIPSALLSAIISTMPSSRQSCHDDGSRWYSRYAISTTTGGGEKGWREEDWGLSCIRLYRAIAIYVHMNSLWPRSRDTYIAKGFALSHVLCLSTAIFPCRSARSRIRRGARSHMYIIRMYISLRKRSTGFRIIS